MLIELLTPDFVYQSEQGCLTQLVHDGWKQVNIIHSIAGTTRGGHYHKLNEEGFYVISGNFTLSVSCGDQKETYTFSAGDMFKIFPNVFHTFTYDTDTLLVSLYSSGVEISETDKDIWTE